LNHKSSATVGITRSLTETGTMKFSETCHTLIRFGILSYKVSHGFIGVILQRGMKFSVFIRLNYFQWRCAANRWWSATTRVLGRIACFGLVTRSYYSFRGGPLGKLQSPVYLEHMNKFILIVTAAISVSILVPLTNARAESFLGKFGDWEAFTDKDGDNTICYIGSEPKKMRGKYKKRGASYVLITHRPAEKSKNVISIRAGYRHKRGSGVSGIIGERHFKLFTREGWAFAPDADADNALVIAMMRGVTMTVKGVSSRGTKTNDTYSLRGFTAAYRAIGKVCKIQ